MTRDTITGRKLPDRLDRVRRLRAPYASRSGGLLSRLLWKLLNRRRPIAGWPVTMREG